MTLPHESLAYATHDLDPTDRRLRWTVAGFMLAEGAMSLTATAAQLLLQLRDQSIGSSFDFSSPAGVFESMLWCIAIAAHTALLITAVLLLRRQRQCLSIARLSLAALVAVAVGSSLWILTRNFGPGGSAPQWQWRLTYAFSSLRSTLFPLLLLTLTLPQFADRMLPARLGD